MPGQQPPSGRSEMIQLEVENVIIRELLQEKFIKPSSVDQQFVDFDGVRYHLHTPERKTELLLSMDIRCWPDLVLCWPYTSLEVSLLSRFVGPIRRRRGDVEGIRFFHHHYRTRVLYLLVAQAGRVPARSRRAKRPHQVVGLDPAQCPLRAFREGFRSTERIGEDAAGT
jgi:hypothetical protein